MSYRATALGISALDSTAEALATASSSLAIGIEESDYWMQIPSEPGPEVGGWYEVQVGTKLQFAYSTHHNVYVARSAKAYDSCDLEGGFEAAGYYYGATYSFSSLANLYEAVVVEAGELYVFCSAHCGLDQKVRIRVVEDTSQAVTLTAPGSPYCYEVGSHAYAESCLLGAAHPFVSAIWPTMLLLESATVSLVTQTGSCVEQGYTKVITNPDPYYGGPTSIYALPGTSLLQPTMDMRSFAAAAWWAGDSAWRIYFWAWASTWMWVLRLVDADWWITSTDPEAHELCAPPSNLRLPLRGDAILAAVRRPFGELFKRWAFSD